MQNSNISWTTHSFNPWLGCTQVSPGCDIVGGESGPRHRRMVKEWAIAVRDHCRAAGVPFFFKQWGGRTPDAGGHLLDGIVHHEFPTPVRRRPVAPAAMELLSACTK